MVKRGGKEVVTVEIFKETYDIMKSAAQKNRWNTKEYINSVLESVVEREEFLRSYMPYLGKVGYESSILFIRDSKLQKTAEVQLLKDRTLYCSICESKDCMHIHYALALPEIVKLYLKKPRGQNSARRS
ncbi:MAG TPA: hypothetical protein VJP79_00890 [Nitrososphaera sp.]|nr:hypothetical protein [Nitrososphaera sp.]